MLKSYAQQKSITIYDKDDSSKNTIDGTVYANGVYYENSPVTLDLTAYKYVDFYSYCNDRVGGYCRINIRDGNGDVITNNYAICMENHYTDYIYFVSISLTNGNTLSVTNSGYFRVTATGSNNTLSSYNIYKIVGVK